MSTEPSAYVYFYRVIVMLIIGMLLGLSSMLIFGLIFGLSGGLIIGLIFGLSGGLERSLSNIIPIEQLIFYRQLDKDSLIFGLVAGLLFILPFGLNGKPSDGLVAGLGGGLMTVLLLYDGDAYVQFVVLSRLLNLYNYAPLNYARFLDYCADRIFLRKVGSGYIFIHRLLLEHFANLTEEDIKRLVGSRDGR